MEEIFLNSPRNLLVLLSIATYGILIQGTAKLNSQLFLACMDQFHIGRKEASVPFTLVQVIRSASGLLTGYLGRKYGARNVTDLGCFLCVVGIGGCFFAKNITTVSILWGVINGLGVGLGSLLLPHILRDFFDKHYDKSHGYYMAGSGVGGILLPLLADSLLFQYGAPGTYLIISALVTNCFVCSLVLRSLKIGPITTEKSEKKVFAICVEDLNDRPQTKCQTMNEIPTPKLQNDQEHSDSETKSPQQTIHKWRMSQPATGPSINLLSYNTKTFQSEEIGPRIRTSGNVLIMNNLSDKYSELNHDPIKQEANQTNTNSTKIVVEIFHLFIDPPFIIIVVTQSIFLFIFHTTNTIIIDFARDVGVSTELEVYTLMNLAISDTVGRIFSGYITDGGYISQLNFYCLSFCIVGAMLSVLTLIKDFIVLMIALVVLGLIIGGINMIGVGLMFSFIEEERMIIAMPCRYIVYPFLGLSKPFLIEFFREGQGSYSGLFYFMAALCFFCTTLSLFLPASKKLREKWKAKKEYLCTK